MEPTYKKIDNIFFDPTKPLGKGAFATVYKGYDEKNKNAPVAVKVIPAAKLLESEDQYNLFMREIDVLRQVKGEHIVQLLDVKRTPNNLYIFTEFCDSGDLEKNTKNKREFTEEEALVIIKSIADAFESIERLDIIGSKGHRIFLMHRDIKPANILFHKGCVKVADFGFAKVIDDVDKDIRKAHTLLGTPLYMAPQILNDESYSAKCDVWSSGVLLYEIIFGKLPWNGNSVPNLFSNIKTNPLTFPKTISPETKDLLTKMLKIKDEERISWKDVYEHPAVKKIDLRSQPISMSTSVTQSPRNQPQGGNQNQYNDNKQQGNQNGYNQYPQYTQYNPQQQQQNYGNKYC